jgi:hypothetical protein
LAGKERLYTYGLPVLPQSINLPLEVELARSLHWDSLFGFGSANRVLALDSTRRHSSMLLYRGEDHRGDRYGELFRLCGVVPFEAEVLAVVCLFGTRLRAKNSCYTFLAPHLTPIHNKTTQYSNIIVNIDIEA